jgi:stage V sporulation protein SpoVS
LYGAEPEEEQALSEIIETLVEVMCGAMETAASPEAEPELLTAFLSMCHRCLVFRPGILLALPCVPRLFQAACGCVCHQELTHTRAAINFLTLFLTGTAAAAAHREGAAHCLQASGAELMRQCIRGLAGASPDNLIELQVELLCVLRDSAPTAVAGWLALALADPSLNLGAMPRNGSALAAFSRAVGQEPTSASTFQTVAADFSRMCRGNIRPL